jgi:hypothetical protein
MPTLAEHFAAILKDASLHRISLDFDAERDLLSLMQGVAKDLNASKVILGSEDPAAIYQTIKQSKAQGIDLRKVDELAQAVGFSEMPGIGKYQTGDLGWIECLLNYYKYRNDRAPFPSPVAPAGITALADKSKLTIGIVGDWGTGVWDASATPSSGNIARRVIGAMQGHTPDYAIHLGDVYYSGGTGEETANFLNDWPFNNGRGYSLNSNHEMYSGGHGYYGTLLADDRFKHQTAGYFALTNSQWLIIGLDSAYFSTSHLYQDGAISPADFTNPVADMAQVNWLKQVLQLHQHKRVILMTHHDGFDVDPSSGKVTIKPLYRQITALMQNVKDWWWYWGHVHTAIAYRRIFFTNNSAVTPRCVGHGAIPYMPFPRDFSRLGGGIVAVEWTETDLARDPALPLRAPNGFLLVTLDGADLREEFYDENDRQRWSNH